MKRTLTLTSAVVVAALSLPAMPAAAQQHRGGGNQGGGGGRVASAPRQSSGQARAATPRGSYSAPSYRSAPSGRSFSMPSQAQAQPRTAGPRTSSAPQAVPRNGGNATYRGGAQAIPRNGGNGTYRGGAQAIPRNGGSGTYRGGAQAVPRNYGGGGYAARPGYGGSSFRGGYYPSMARPDSARVYVRPYGWRPYYPYHFVRPYYVFSPWLSLGFGIWCGYPVPYPWVYLGDYQPTVFGSYSDDYQAVPSAPSYGGVSFDVQPADANLFVDGQYVGVVGSFGATNEPLTLEPGPHRIAIQKEGYRPLEWDVTIEGGQVIPYRGVLERQ